ncbi:MAG: hypothetical protein ABR867_04980 [Nitrososphaerales archaeon]
MSSSEDDEQGTKYRFKGKFGEVALTSHAIVEASQFDVDTFIRDILGLTKNKETKSTETKS